MSYSADFENTTPTVSCEEKNYDKPLGTINYRAPAVSDPNCSTAEKSNDIKESTSDYCNSATQIEPSENTSNNERANGYDIPKGTINEEIVKNSTSAPTSPTKQPLLPPTNATTNGQTSNKKIKAPPPMIVVSSSEDHEKVKVIFEYDKGKGKLKDVDVEGYEVIAPNILVRNKRIILVSAFIILIFLLFSAFIAIHFALKKTRKHHM